MVLSGSVCYMEDTAACGDNGELGKGLRTVGGAHHDEGDGGGTCGERERAPVSYF